MMSIEISPEAEVVADIIYDIGDHRPYVMLEAICSILVAFTDAFIENHIEESNNAKAEADRIYMNVINRKT